MVQAMDTWWLLLQPLKINLPSTVVYRQCFVMKRMEKKGCQPFGLCTYDIIPNDNVAYKGSIKQDGCGQCKSFLLLLRAREFPKAC